MDGRCWACDADFDPDVLPRIPYHRYALPIGPSGCTVPNSYIGDWAGSECCKKCYDLHMEWSEQFRYFGYMLTDGRLELTGEELVAYECLDIKTL